MLEKLDSIIITFTFSSQGVIPFQDTQVFGAKIKVVFLPHDKPQIDIYLRNINRFWDLFMCFRYFFISKFISTFTYLSKCNIQKVFMRQC